MGLTLPAYDIYSVLSNGSGDSSLETLTDQFLEPVGTPGSGPGSPALGKQFQVATILDVASVTNDTTPLVTTDENHNFATGQLIRPYGGDMTEFDATHVNYVGDTSPDPDDGLLYFQITVTGATTFTLDNVDSTLWDAYTSGAAAPAGFSFFEGASPAVVDDDTWECDSVTTDNFNVTPFPDGTLTYAAVSSVEQQSIVMRHYDVSAGAWTAEAVMYFNNVAPSAKLEFPDPIQFFQNVAFDLSPIKGNYVEDLDGDALTLALVGSWPTDIVIGAGGDSIEGTTADAAGTGTDEVRTTDSVGAVTDISVNWEVIDTETMPEVDTGATTEAAAITAITGAGLQSPTVIGGIDAGTTVGNVYVQTPAAGTVYDIALPTSITVSIDVADTLPGIPPGWHSIVDCLDDREFRDAMRLEAQTNSVWAFWTAGVDNVEDPIPKATGTLNLNIALIKQEANGTATWARWSPGTPALPRSFGNLQLDMDAAITAEFVLS